MYTVYKITNKINGKFYIGVHKTDNPYDNYMGSGVAIKKAIAKYGKSSFDKEILLITESKDEAYNTERELTINYESTDSYNMRQGGVGGFTKENARKGNKNSLAVISREVLSENGKKNYVKNIAGQDHASNGRKGGLANKGKPKSEEFKQHLRDVWARKRIERTGSQAVKAPAS